MRQVRRAQCPDDRSAHASGVLQKEDAVRWHGVSGYQSVHCSYGRPGQTRKRLPYSEGLIAAWVPDPRAGLELLPSFYALSRDEGTPTDRSHPAWVRYDGSP